MFRFVVAALAAVVLAAPLSAQDYPSRPIRLIVPFPPGGGTDAVSRLVAQELAKSTGWTVVVENKAGAGGMIGLQEAAKARNEGYDIVMGQVDNMVIAPAVQRTGLLDPVKDLTPVIQVASSPFLFMAATDGKYKKLGEWVADAKANPGKVTYGTTGIGSDDHLAALMFEKAAGVKFTHVPFKGAAEVHNAIASKQIFMAAMNIGEALQYQKGGSPLRNLVQMSPARTNLAPELATAREQGYDIEMSSLRGMVGPKGLPKDVRERLVKAVAVSVADPEFQAKAAQFFAPLRYLAPAEYEALVREADMMYRAMWKEMPWADR